MGMWACWPAWPAWPFFFLLFFFWHKKKHGVLGAVDKAIYAEICIRSLDNIAGCIGGGS